MSNRPPEARSARLPPRGHAPWGGPAALVPPEARSARLPPRGHAPWGGPAALVPPKLAALVALVALTTAATPALAAQDLPKLRAGQWDILIDRGKAGQGQPPAKSTMCTDDAVQREMLANGMGMSREICTRNDFRREGTRFVGSAECRFGDSKMTSRSVMTLTGDSAYRVDIVATFDPPFMGMKDSRTTLDGKYVGPCRAGLVPGDIVGPAGQKFNVRNLGQGKVSPTLKAPPTATPSAPAKKAAQ